jgi:DNA repair protein RadA
VRAGVRGMTSGLWEAADESARRVSSFRFFSSGSPTIDRLLGGGYRAGRIIELFGRSNTGKTQLAMQAVLAAARAGVRSLYVDTEGAFRPERLEEMARARGWEIDGLLEQIAYIRSDSSSEQMETVRRMAVRPATARCELVVVDTLTRNFSVELPGRSNLSSRQAALDVHLSEMARDAYLNGRAYLLTNRVTFGTSHDVGIGGRTVEQLVHASVMLERDEARVKATLMPKGENVTTRMSAEGVD